jgi:general stress protein 26
VDVGSFADIKQEFKMRVERIIWCSVTTVDRSGRPRSRLLHPLWEGSTGWIMTGRNSFKGKHLAANPHVSCSYWDPQHQQVFADCVASWEDDPSEKERVWELFKTTPEPMGYNPELFWRGGPSDPTFGALKLSPWRIELWSLQDMMSGKEPRVWRA